MEYEQHNIRLKRLRKIICKKIAYCADLVSIRTDHDYILYLSDVRSSNFTSEYR